MSKTTRVVIAAIVVGGLSVGTGVYASTRSVGKEGLAYTGVKETRPASVQATCKTKKVATAVVDATGDSTISTSYVDMPGMSAAISVGGTAPTCVVVHFAAFAFAPGTALEFVRAVLDNVAGSPSEYQFAGADGTWAVSHAVEFVFPSVSPGAHTVKIQWKSFDGASVFVHRRMMDVQNL